MLFRSYERPCEKMTNCINLWWTRPTVNLRATLSLNRLTWVPYEVRQWSANACSSVGVGVKQPLTQHQLVTDLSPWLGNVTATRQMHSSNACPAECGGHPPKHALAETGGWPHQTGLGDSIVTGFLRGWQPANDTNKTCYMSTFKFSIDALFVK